MLKFIKAVSDTVFEMINAVYHDKPLIFIRATFREKLLSYHQAVNEVDLYEVCRLEGRGTNLFNSPVRQLKIYWQCKSAFA